MTLFTLSTSHACFNPSTHRWAPLDCMLAIQVGGQKGREKYKWTHAHINTLNSTYNTHTHTHEALAAFRYVLQLFPLPHNANKPNNTRTFSMWTQRICTQNTTSSPLYPPRLARRELDPTYAENRPKGCLICDCCASLFIRTASGCCVYF